MVQDPTVLEIYRDMPPEGKAAMERKYGQDYFKKGLPTSIQQARDLIQTETAVFSYPAGQVDTLKAFADMLIIEAALSGGERANWTITVNCDGEVWSVPSIASRSHTLFRLPFYFKSPEDANHLTQHFPDLLKALMP